MPQCDLASEFRIGPAYDESRQQFANPRLELKLATLMQDHGNRSGCDHLRQARNIEYRVRLDSQSTLLVGEVPQRVREHDFCACQNSKRTSRESAGIDRLLQHPVNPGE